MLDPGAMGSIFGSAGIGLAPTLASAANAGGALRKAAIRQTDSTRDQYVLGYVPTNQDKDGRWRRLKVEVKKIRGMPRLRTHYRLGYYAPTR